MNSYHAPLGYTFEDFLLNTWRIKHYFTGILASLTIAVWQINVMPYQSRELTPNIKAKTLYLPAPRPPIIPISLPTLSNLFQIQNILQELPCNTNKKTCIEHAML